MPKVPSRHAKHKVHITDKKKNSQNINLTKRKYMAKMIKPGDPNNNKYISVDVKAL